MQTYFTPNNTPNNILNPYTNVPFIYNTNYVPNTTDRFWFYFDFLCYPVIGTPLRFIIMIYIIYQIIRYIISTILKQFKIVKDKDNK